MENRIDIADPTSPIRVIKTKEGVAGSTFVTVKLHSGIDTKDVVIDTDAAGDTIIQFNIAGDLPKPTFAAVVEVEGSLDDFEPGAQVVGKLRGIAIAI